MKFTSGEIGCCYKQTGPISLNNIYKVSSYSFLKKEIVQSTWQVHPLEQQIEAFRVLEAQR